MQMYPMASVLDPLHMTDNLENYCEVIVTVRICLKYNHSIRFKTNVTLLSKRKVVKKRRIYASRIHIVNLILYFFGLIFKTTQSLYGLKRMWMPCSWNNTVYWTTGHKFLSIFKIYLTFVI